MNVLVTGGAGYVGAVLIPKLLDKKYRVTVIDWFIYGDKVFGSYENNPNLRKVNSDLRDKKALHTVLDGIDAVIHLASISNDPSFELDPKLGRSVNFDATKQLADLSKQMGVKRFIFASTSSVYGVKKEKKVTEDLALEPLTDYSKYKALIETYLISLQSPNFCVLILRPATVCGYSPRMRLDLTVNLLTMQALTRDAITVFGGSQTRPNIHIQDITDLYVLSLEYPETKINGRIFNAGGENYSVLRIAEMVKEEVKNPELELVVKSSSDKRSYRITSDKIANEMGFRPKHTVREAISDIARAYNQGLIPNPNEDDRYYNIKTMKKLSGKL